MRHYTSRTLPSKIYGFAQHYLPFSFFMKNQTAKPSISKNWDRSLVRLFLFVMALAWLATPGSSMAQGWWWGSRINPGFDRKTVIQVSGTVTEIQIVNQGGPSTLRLQAPGEVFDVVLAPGWFLFELHADLKIGDSLSVEGSRVPDRQGNMYLIAARVTNVRTGDTLALRDEAGRLLWLGRGPSKQTSP